MKKPSVKRPVIASRIAEYSKRPPKPSIPGSKSGISTPKVTSVLRKDAMKRTKIA
jgi:hypothetical protein